MVEESADKSYELCLINIHESVSTCLWKTTLVCLGMSYGGVVVKRVQVPKNKHQFTSWDEED